MNKLKITKEHFDHLKAVIQPLDTPHLREKYILLQIPNASSVRDLDKRYRNDLLSAAVPALWICNNLYPYLSDLQIDNALKKIVPPLNNK